jgi:hypothetical protein
MTQPNIYVLEGGVPNHVYRIIGRKFFLKSDIKYQFFYQTESLPISKRQFETSEVMRILDIRHIISK